LLSTQIVQEKIRTQNEQSNMTVTIYGIKNCDTMKKAFA